MLSFYLIAIICMSGKIFEDLKKQVTIKKQYYFVKGIFFGNECRYPPGVHNFVRRRYTVYDSI